MLKHIIDNKALQVMLTINGIFVFAASMFPALFALFVQEIGGDAFVAGSIWATYAVVSGVLTLVISRYGDRLKEQEYLVMIGYALRALAWIGYVFAGTLWHLFVLQLLLAIGEACGTPAFNALYSSHLSKGRYVRQWGVMTAINSVLIGLAAMFGGYLTVNFGFRVLFVLMAGLAVLSFVILLVQPRKLI